MALGGIAAELTRPFSVRRLALSSAEEMVKALLRHRLGSPVFRLGVGVF